ncbi:hypothetical protein NL532_10150 [Mesorhizobium sp. C120A]|uniref:hypothetical protein n=1 Tax=unclassified Mesorhizobium TaxID=325217 RepID=UPI0003D045A4|nr:MULTISPECIES: hypothetical protein [unclassified Mesorhizobium]ESZ66642.1 hypothetical protein X728_04075 [Mesorhizobium sp. L103C120A0]WJI46956.1 hypothetical protein NL532_10150 [Mesorhizobium sp. C120A]
MADELPALAALRSLVQPPDGMWRSRWAMDGGCLRQRQQRGCGETAAPRQGEGIMIVVPTGVKVHLALSHADMRNRLDGLATLIQ